MSGKTTNGPIKWLPKHDEAIQTIQRVLIPSHSCEFWIFQDPSLCLQMHHC